VRLIILRDAGDRLPLASIAASQLNHKHYRHAATIIVGLASLNPTVARVEYNSLSCWGRRASHRQPCSGGVLLYSGSTIKMDQAALESRSIQSLIDETSIPEAKMYVGGVRSTQAEPTIQLESPKREAKLELP